MGVISYALDPGFPVQLSRLGVEFSKEAYLVDGQVMERKRHKSLWRIGLLFLPLILLGLQASLPFVTVRLKNWPVIYGARLFPGVENARPGRVDVDVELFQGVHYHRELREQPRPLMIHTVSIDLTAPDIGFLVTPNDPTEEVPARTTSRFLNEFGAQVAINGSYFEPVWARTPWDYYPRAEDPVYIKGLSISDSMPYSDSLDGWPAMCIAGEQIFFEPEGCPEDTRQALAGKEMLIRQGEIVTYENVRVHPRTAVALSADRATLWLVVVDGRQPNYSEGVTLEELANILLDLGANMALNLDGGGSSTLVTAGVIGPDILNSPIHTNIAMRQRPVANHLGVFARPLEIEE